MIRKLMAFLFLAGTCAAAEPKPLLVVIELNPWLDVIGSDSPMLAIYDDNTMLYRPERPTGEQPYSRRELTDGGATMTQLQPADSSWIGKTFTLSSATDQITTIIWTPKGMIEIYGNWRESMFDGRPLNPVFQGVAEREKALWQSLPPTLRQSLMRVDEVRRLSGTPWFPAQIEVMFWPYEYAPDESVAWPAGWPDLQSKGARKRRDELYSVFVPLEKLPQLRALLASRKEKAAVLINGRKMAVSLRFPFPAESEWRK